MKQESFPTNEHVIGGFSRHAKSLRHADQSDPASLEYPELTIHGIEQARLTARTELLKTIEEAPSGTVLFIGAKSDQERTGNTAEVFGEELKETLKDKGEFLVLTKKDIDAIRLNENESKEFSVMDYFNKIIKNNPEKKIIIDYPLYIKQLGYGYENRWTQKNPETGKVDKTEYFAQILKKHNNDHAECIRDWLENDGVLTLPDGTTLQGPRPEDVAKQYLEGLQRLYKFTKKQIPDRPILVHGVGHQWDLDAVATFLAKGKVTYQDWVDIMDRPEARPSEQVIGETETMSDIVMDPKTGITQVVYRGKKFNYKP